MPADAPRPSHLRGPRLWAGLAAAMGALLVLRLVYQVGQDLAEGNRSELPERLFEELTGVLLALPWVAAIVVLLRRVPLAPPRMGGALLVHGAAFLVVSTIHTATMLLARQALAPPFGFDGYEARFTVARFAFEAANDLPIVVALLGVLSLVDHLLGARDRERREAALERSLLEAELRTLRLQLQPHFLFNALNTISSTMYDDPAAADAQLGQLAELLRTSLRTTHAHEVSVAEEVALLEQYLALMRARFGDRLTAHVAVDPASAACRVPSMLLQPLVENAVRHGGVGTRGRGVVRVIVGLAHDARGEWLEVRVHDDGPGLAPGRDPMASGTGLAATARRLRLLFGAALAMRAGDAAGGGFEVVLRLPARAADVPEPAFA
jgi:two-component system LytT family sensor kinase